MLHLFFRPIAALALLCLTFCPPLLAQKNKSQQPLFQCAVPELTPQQRQALEAEAKFALQVKQASGGKATVLTYVPIRPHILRRSNGTGGYSMSSLNNVMALTNSYYLKNGVGIQFYFSGATPDYVDNDALFAQFVYNTDEATVASRNVTNAMNQYYVQSFSNGIGGYAKFPANSVNATQSFIVDEGDDVDMGNRLVPHELGHNFNLIHPHEPANGYELITRGSGANCTTTGDLVCDTPADPYGRFAGASSTCVSGCPPTYSCGFTEPGTGLVYNPSPTNIMSYYFPCTHDFTPGQYDRLDAALALRQSHTAYTLNAPPTAVNTPTNLIANAGSGNVVLTWADNATNEMGYFVERSMLSSSGFVPIGGVAPNITTFTDATAPGSTTVYYRVRPSNSTIGGISANASVTTSACRPTFSNGCGFGDGINSFSFNNTLLSQNTGCGNTTTSYSQYTATTAAVTAGITYPFSGTLLSPVYTEGIAIWADLNRNGSFSDAGELLFQSSPASTSFAGSLTIPVSTSAGLLPIRIVAAENVTPGNPCGSYSYGETEDYQLSVGVATAGCDPLEPNDTYQTATTLTAGANYTSPPVCFSVTSDNDWFRWSYNGQVFYILAHPYSYNTTGPYQLSLTFTNNNLLTVSTIPTSSGQSLDTYLKLYASDGTTLLIQDDDSGGNGFSRLAYALSGPQPCNAPFSLYVGSLYATSVYLSWSGGAGSPAGTVYELQYRPLSSGTWTTISSLSTAGYSLSGLPTGTDYQWQVRSFCRPGESSAYTAGTTFRTPACTTPTLSQTYPLFGSATLNWSYAGSGLTYEVQWQAQGVTAWNSATVVNATSYYLTGLSVNTAYNWRVRTACSATESSTFSAPGSFTTYCGTPDDLNASSISAYAATLGWNNPTSGALNTVWWRQQGSTGWATPGEYVVGSTYVLTGLTNGITYEWRVDATCPTASATVTTGFSGTGTFTTSCPTPTNFGEYLTSYFGYNQATSVNLSWYGFTNGVYQLQWRPQGSTVWTNTPILNQTSGQYLLQSLTPATAYDLRVQAVCANGITSGFASTSWTTSPVVTCSATAPTLSGTSAIGATAATLYWLKSLAELRWRAVGQTAWNVASKIPGLLYSPYGNQNTYFTALGLQPSTAYEWQVGGQCDGLSTAAYGPVQTFTTTGCTTPTYPTTSAYCVGPSGALLTWSGQIGGIYEVQYQPAGGTPTTVGGISTASYALTGLTTGTVYQWQVRAVCGTGQSSSFTSPVSFTTACNAPGYLYASYQAADSCSYQRVNWQGCSALAGQYEVQYRRQSSSAWTAGGTVTGSTFLIGNLTPVTGYDYRVRALCGNGNVSNFTVGSFTSNGCSLCDAPYSYYLTVSDITANAATVKWGSSTSTNTYWLRWRAGYTGTWTTATVTGRSYRITSLTTDMPYDWQVQSVCSNGQYSSWSPTGFFRTVCNIPLSVTATGVRSTSALLGWNGYGSGLTYEAQLRQPGGSWTTFTSIGSESLILTNLSTGTTYEGRVGTRCADGSVTDYSAPTTFKTVCQEPLYLYTSSTDPHSALFNWRGNTGDVYEMQWRAQGSGFWNMLIISAGNSAVASILLTSLTGATVYEWQVRTVCGGGTTSAYPTQPLTFVTPPDDACTGGMTTIRNGDWNDPGTWACNRIPTSADAVTIGHSVTVPTGITGNALTISYGAGGKLTIGNGSKVRLGP